MPAGEIYYRQRAHIRVKTTILNDDLGKNAHREAQSTVNVKCSEFNVGQTVTKLCDEIVTCDIISGGQMESRLARVVSNIDVGTSGCQQLQDQICARSFTGHV